MKKNEETNCRARPQGMWQTLETNELEKTRKRHHYSRREQDQEPRENNRQTKAQANQSTKY
ncbi:MAG: hypothetical protein ABJO54_08025 [Hyphomicrobiales bacterium]|uniref:hypothetical protein n=1 Tax=Hyphomonas sp. TaxID=87 RepID=UPI003299A49F